MEKLAIHGGKPVRSEPLTAPMLRGALMSGAEETERATQVAQSKSYFRYYGPNPQHYVDQLESRICETFDIPYALGVTSGTAALIVALKALGIGYGDKVIVPANTFTATPGAVVCSNAVPVYADMDDTLNMNPADLERVMDDDVRAIIAVHINGQPCNMDAIMAFARKHNIAVIEDVAQSLGSQYKGRYTGTFGDINAFSFQMQKIITAGEGGAVTTRSMKLFERAVRYHDQGSFRDRAKYSFDEGYVQEPIVGQNYRMSELTGAVLLEQWNKLDTIVGSMRRHHKRMRNTLQAEIPGIQFRGSNDEDGDICCTLGIIHRSRANAEAFVEAMNAENVFSWVMYGGKPIYMTSFLLQPKTLDKNNFPFDYPFRNPVIYKEGMCPVAEDLLPKVTLLPVGPHFTDQDVDQLIEATIKVYNGLNLHAALNI